MATAQPKEKPKAKDPKPDRLTSQRNDVPVQGLDADRVIGMGRKGDDNNIVRDHFRTVYRFT